MGTILSDIASVTLAGLEGGVEVGAHGDDSAVTQTTRTSQRVPPTCRDSLSKPGVGGAEMKFRNPLRNGAYSSFCLSW